MAWTFEAIEAQTFVSIETVERALEQIESTAAAMHTTLIAHPEKDKFVSIEAVERALEQLKAQIQTECDALNAVFDQSAPVAAVADTDQEFVSFETVERALNQIPGVAGLIQAEYNALIEAEIAALHTAEFLKQVRKRAHLSQAAVAGKMGVKPSRISEVEKGGRNGLTVSVLARFVEACGAKLQLSARPRDPKDHTWTAQII
jgi:predicted XRE-type DNA-binding protein